MTTVYWTPYEDVVGKSTSMYLSMIDPTPLLPEFIKSRDATAIANSGHYFLCPAFQDYYKNTYVIYSPVDIDLEYDKESGYLKISKGQEFYDNYVVFRNVKINDANPPLISLAFKYMFIADKSCMVEQLPAALHDNKVANNIRLIPGTFNISKWYRPVEIAFEIANVSQTISIKRGDPLCYVRFIPTDKSKINFVYKELTSDLLEVVDRCVKVKLINPKIALDTLYVMAEKLRNSLWFNKKKCPFNWRNK